MKRSKCLVTTVWAVVAVAMMLGGCSTDNPIEPTQMNTSGRVVQSTTGPVTILGLDRTQQATSSLSKASGVDVQREEFIQAAVGGEIVVGNTVLGHSKLVFEPNALPQDMTISITYRKEEYCEGIFEPHGTQFNEPVLVELSYRNADVSDYDENELRIYYYNESTGLWELVGGTVDVANKTVSVYLEHFSRYAIVKT